MSSAEFVGRADGVEKLTNALQREMAKGRRLLVQSIEGPGGIGKSALFEHVLHRSELAGQEYLTIRISGNGAHRDTLPGIMKNLVNSAASVDTGSKPPGFFFPKTMRILAIFDSIRSAAEEEIRASAPGDRADVDQAINLIDRAIAIGTKLNEIVPITKRFLDVAKLDGAPDNLKELHAHVTAFSLESAGFFEKLGLGGSVAQRNDVRTNFLDSLSNAFVTDLTALLFGYERKEWYRPSLHPLPGTHRLLLIIDDYEALQEMFAPFLVGHLLPKLVTARFETTTVILGRDTLQNTHPGWDQNLGGSLLPAIPVKPLARTEFDALVNSLGVTDEQELEQAWSDTEGYPFTVHLWVEEHLAGGKSAVMLQRFYDRTTRWLTQQQKVWLERLMFLDRVDMQTLPIALEGITEPTKVLEWFRHEASLRDTHSDVFRVRPYIRSRLIAYLKLCDPERCQSFADLGRSFGRVDVPET